MIDQTKSKFETISSDAVNKEPKNIIKMVICKYYR